ncbi:MAG: Gfo/Idh/MocA family oxidoreductase [Kiritimatiellia bacterium]
MKKIRVGVAGLGRIGWGFHAKNLAKHADYELVAVTDVESERRTQAELELGCKAYADFAEMIANADLEAVVIATPTHLHREMALQAFDKGLHVLLEKPMALNREEARDIVQAAASAGRMLTVYQPHRLAAYFQHLRQIVQSGKIGRVYWVRCGMFNYARRNDWQSLLKFGGGMLSNYGAHGVDQILGLVGFEVKRVFCDLQRVATLGDAEDVAKIVLETRQGVVGEVEISMASALNPYKLLVWGTHGGIMYSRGVSAGHFDVRWFEPAQLPPKELNEKLASANRQYPSDPIAFIEEKIAPDPSRGIDVFADFALSIRTGTPPTVKPEETLVVMDVLDRCRKDSGDIRDFTRE